MSTLKQQLKDFIEDEGVSQAAIGKAIGYSGSTISQYLDDIYSGNIAAVEKAIKDFLEIEHERKATPREKIPYVQISAAKKVYDVTRTAHTDGEISVITGDPGLGKTLSLTNYHNKYPKKTAFINAFKGYTVRTLVRNLHIAFFGGTGNGNKNDLIEEICGKLQGSNMCIIVDQAEYLNLTCLETIRHIYDETECGLVLAGTERLIENLRGRHKELAQLYSRVGRAVRLEKLTPEDTEKLIHAALPNSNGVWKAFHTHCNGNARILSKIVRRAKRIASKNSSPVTDEIVTRIARQHKEALGIA
jgi:DNA transposition AAA+ family ATPase